MGTTCYAVSYRGTLHCVHAVDNYLSECLSCVSRLFVECIVVCALLSVVLQTLSVCFIYLFSLFHR